MKIKQKLGRFLRFEGKLLLLTCILILIAGCFNWHTFFRTPSEAAIRKDFLIEDIAAHLHIDTRRLQKYTGTELEIISRLDLNALIALEQNADAMVRVYDELKDFQLFYDIVEEFGPHHVIPVLDFFYEDGNLSIELEQKIMSFINMVFTRPVAEDTLSERQKRLLLILSEIQYQKHNFLARFIYSQDGIKRNYVATTTSTIVNFFTGGLAQLNTALATRGVKGVSKEELIDAGVDILVLIPFAVYLTRTAKTVFGTARGTTSVTAEALTASRSGKLARVGILHSIPIRTLLKFKYVKWYILGLAIVKPSLLNHAAALVAKLISVPPIIIKTGFWFLILFPLLNLLVPVLLVVRYWARKLYGLRKKNIASQIN